MSQKFRNCRRLATAFGKSSALTMRRKRPVEVYIDLGAETVAPEVIRAPQRTIVKTIIGASYTKTRDAHAQLY